MRDLEKASCESREKTAVKKAKKRGGSGGNKKTHPEEEGFKKQKRGLGIVMEWTSASAVGLFMGRQEEV